MQVHWLKSKVRRDQGTASSLDYAGGRTVVRDLLDQVGFISYERMLCSKLAHGQRFETCGISGESGSGASLLNGATGHLGKVGDPLTIASFTAVVTAQAAGWQPGGIVLGEKNAEINARGS